MTVLDITENKVDHFNKLIKTNNALVFIYSDHCGHCTTFKPIWKKFINKIKEDNPPFIIAKVQSSVFSDLDVDTNILGVPTIRFFSKITGKKIMDFEKERTLPNLMTFYNKIKQKGINSKTMKPKKMMNGGSKKYNRKSKKRNSNKKKRNNTRHNKMKRSKTNKNK